MKVWQWYVRGGVLNMSCPDYTTTLRYVWQRRPYRKIVPVAVNQWGCPNPWLLYMYVYTWSEGSVYIHGGHSKQGTPTHTHNTSFLERLNVTWIVCTHTKHIQSYTYTLYTYTMGECVCVYSEAVRWWPVRKQDVTSVIVVSPRQSAQEVSRKESGWVRVF